VTIDLASLSPLFEPRSVAVIGASTDPLKIGGRPVSFLKNAFRGPIYPINPKATEIQGLPAYRAIGDIAHHIDLAICTVPGEFAEEALKSCAAKGVRAVVMFSAGFAEVGEEGRLAQERFAEIAQRSGMRLMGPNCMGLANLHAGMVASFHPAFGLSLPPPGRIGLVSQSGAFGGLCIQMACERGVGFAHMVTTGNEADVQAADALAYLAQDAATAVIMLYLEGCRDGARMIEALELARKSAKPVVAIKLGRTEAGAKAAQSHTAALAGADAVVDAIFRQFGVYRATNIEEFFDIGCAAAIGCLPANDRVGLVTVSGGIGVLMADDAVARGLDVAELPEQAQGEFKKLVPFAGVNNPLDVTGQIINDSSLLEKAATLMLGKADYGSLVCFQGSLGSSYNPRNMASVLDTWLAIKQRFPDRLITVSGLLAPDFRRSLEAAGIPTAREPTDCVRSVGALNRFARTFAAPFHRPSIAPPDGPLPAGRLNEIDAMKVLQRAGLAVPDGRLVNSPEAAASAAETLGYPVVMKVVSGAIAHKSDIGGVRLKLADAAAVRAAFDGIMGDVRARAPDTPIDGCLVAPMIEGGGVETIIGVTRDPVFGPMVMFGLGGIMVEVLGDVTFRCPPFDEAEAHRMIREIRSYRILEGVRGAPPADIDALASALSAVSRFAAAHADQIVTLEANPLLVGARGSGAMALDAVAVIKPRPAC
jgi:acyl-CoA synthetase (NDP forming)